MKLHTLIPAAVLSMAVLVQAQSNTAPPAATGLGGIDAASKSPEALKPGMGKELIVNDDGSVTLSAGTLRAVIAEIEQRIGQWPPVAGGDKPAMPNLLYGTDTLEAVVPTDLRLRGVSLLQAITLTAAAAGCTLEPIFSPAAEADEVRGSGSASTGKSQTIIGYRVVLAALARRALSAAQQFAELDRQLNTLSATLGQNHPRVVSARDHIKQLMARKIETPSGANLKIPATKIPATVRGRLIDQLGKGLGGKPLVFVKDGSTVITDGPTSADGTFQVELPVDQKWQVVLLEDGKHGPRSEEMTTPTPGSSTSDEPNYDLDLHLDGNRLKAQLTELKLSEKAPDGMPKVRVVNSPSVPGADSILANGIYGGGVAPEHVDVVPYAAFSGRATPSSRGNGPFVQVYAVGTMLSGSVTEISEKESCFRELVGSAIAMDGVAGDKMPDLNFHKQSLALIVKATARQHEIIDQVIKAVKENATHEPAPKKP